jgi:hypothetical protein
MLFAYAIDSHFFSAFLTALLSRFFASLDLAGDVPLGVHKEIARDADNTLVRAATGRQNYHNCFPLDTKLA